ncbi:hypothetical protein QJQ45_019007 [Haematococcus lacustris]|nr:hypothetical protein QJQ45_019007 [Haematococcus lacustris]
MTSSIPTAGLASLHLRFAESKTEGSLRVRLCDSAITGSSTLVPTFHLRLPNAQRRKWHFLPLPPEQAEVSRPLVRFLNRHLLPVLMSSVSIQQHALQAVQDRVKGLRSMRPRNPFHKKHSQPAEGGGSSLYLHRGPRPTRQGQRLYEAARACERQLDPLGAASLLEQAVAADPRQSEWLSLAAKQWSDATYLDSANQQQAVEYNLRAIELAHRSAALSPGAAHAYIARCVSRGRLAVHCGDNKLKAQLAREAADDAHKALELEPNNDYAHHLMGRWHYEMAGLNGMVRALVRLLYGTTLMQGSYAEALEHYKTASTLAPRTLVHRVEYGRTLHKVGQVQNATHELHRALTLDVEDLNGHLQAEDAKDLLRRILQVRSSP